MCVVVFVYLGVCRVTLENRSVERRDSSVCLSLLGCFPRTQEALDITLAGGKKKNTIANHSRKMLGLQTQTEGWGGKQKGRERERMRWERVKELRMRAGGRRMKRGGRTQDEVMTLMHVLTLCVTPGPERRTEDGSLRRRSSVTGWAVVSQRRAEQLTSRGEKEKLPRSGELYFRGLSFRNSQHLRRHKGCVLLLCCCCIAL